MALLLEHSAPGRIDPIGGAAAWTLAPLAGAAAVAYAIFQTVTHRSEIVHPELSIVAVGLLLSAAIVLSVAAHPSVARLGRSPAVFLVALAVLAAALSALSKWGHNRYLQDDWGQIGVGLLVFGMQWLRPPREILLLGVVGAVILGLMGAAQANLLQITNTPYVYAVVSATPVLVFAASAATVGFVVARVSMDWLRSAWRGTEAFVSELRNIEEDALHRAQLEELRQATLPLLASIARRGEITADDVVVAARASALLRERALRDVRRSWVDSLIHDACLDPAAVSDPDHLLPRMPVRERAVISAFFNELVRLRVVDPHSVAINVVRAPAADSSERAAFEARALTLVPRKSVRRTARPFFSVLRALSGDAVMNRTDNTMTMRFGFDPA